MKSVCPIQHRCDTNLPS